MKRAGRYGDHLFKCFDDPRIPATTNDLERFFGVSKQTLRHALGCGSTSITLGTPNYASSSSICVASSRLRHVGASAVPSWSERGALTDEFPLLLTTGARQPGFCNSQVRGVPMVEARVGPVAAELSPETATELGLSGAEQARLTTAHGSVTVALRPTDELPPRGGPAPSLYGRGERQRADLDRGLRPGDRLLGAAGHSLSPGLIGRVRACGPGPEPAAL